MFERNKLSVAVKAAISASALGMASTTVPALAQEEPAVVEEVVVTGSRIKRAVGDEATPVTVINARDLEVSGYSSVADVLRNTTYNSFGLVPGAFGLILRPDRPGRSERARAGPLRRAHQRQAGARQSVHRQILRGRELDSADRH